MDFAAKLLGNSLGNVEAEAHSLSVELLWCVEESKELKQFGLIFLLDTDPRVLYWDLNEPMAFRFIEELVMLSICQVLLVRDEFAFNFDKTSRGCKFESIWRQVKDDLLKSLSVCANSKLGYLLLNQRTRNDLFIHQWEVLKFVRKVDLIEVSFKPHNAHGVDNGFSDIEWRDIFPELSRPQLSEVKHVIYEGG